MRYLLDTDICIYIIKQRPASVFKRFKPIPVGDIGISSITYSELCFGVSKSQQVARNLAALQSFVSPLEIIPYDDTVGLFYGKVRHELESAGKPIDPLDTLIAAHAMSLAAILVTNNAKEFRRVQGLAVEVWA
ncbi:type II toxin-antitoxin system VapC family toxin [Horticoccus luteus]|uniref:Ribonuclease VapC n=1 Tax=Horticoccus luteus TaxID=2862869 RepID=A0A8F9TUB5_9BACT|nr:type II toxin-antitoxin system VapC family toxin [Horticoccus luteus]QYM79216.1 type II toxin-antitoxin system VapC family toxin [Horticoccus luteus]